MRKITHILFTFAIATLIGFEQTPKEAIYVATAVLATTLPDFDLRLKHRKLLHNLFVPVALFFILLMTQHSLGIDGLYLAKAFALGWFSHIMLDSITKRGVALLYPFSSKHYGLRLCDSNSLICNLLISGLSVVIALLRLTNAIIS